MKPVATYLYIVAIIVSTVSAKKKPRVLDLAFVTTRCIEANLDITRATIETKNTLLNRRQARAKFLPSASSSISAGASSSRPSSAIETTLKDVSNISASINSDITLFDGLKNINTCRKTECAWLASCDILEARKQQVTYTVILQYVQALLDSDVVVLEQTNLEAQNVQQKKVEEFHATGECSLADVLSERYLTAQAELRYLKAQHDYTTGKLLISKTIGDSIPDSDFMLRGLFPDSVILQFNLSDDTLLTVAFQKRKDVQAQKEMIQASKFNIKAAKGGFFPSIALSASMGTRYYDNNRISGITAGQVIRENGYISTALSISIPFLNRLSTITAVGQASITMENTRLELNALKRKVAFEIRQAALDYTLVVEQLRVSIIKLSSAREAYDATAMRYDVGAASHTDLVVAKTHYDAAVLDRLKASYEILEAVVIIAYASGNIETILSVLTKEIN